MISNIRHTVSPEHRNLLAFVLTIDSKARQQYVHLMRMGAKNIRPDTMLIRQVNGAYDRMPDPGAWHTDVRGIHVCLVRHNDGSWSINS